MTQLRLLILFLLVSFKSISQTDTQKVILSDSIAREVVKELIRYDFCKQELKLTDNQIENFKSIIKEKDSIIKEKDSYIEKQETFIGRSKKLKLHLYFGVAANKLYYLNCFIYSNIQLEYKQLALGINSQLGFNNKQNNNVFLEYKNI